MAFIPTPNAVEVVIKHTVAGNAVFNVFNFETDDPITLPQLEELVVDVEAAWKARLISLASTNVVLTSTQATDLSSASAPSVENFVTAGGTGTRAGTTLPLNSAVCVKKTTNNRGRSFRGRNYWYGLVATDCPNAESVGAAAGTALTTGFINFVGDIISGLAGNALNDVILSLFSNGAPRAQGLTTAITDYAVELFLDSQRRRLEGRGV